ncbi:MAG: protease-like activity factor CPAF [Bdellovibrionota bacterium]
MSSTIIKSVISLVLISLLSFTSEAQISKEFKNKLADEMKFIANVYSQHYAPKQWKEKHLGWNLESELGTALAKINAASSVYDYRNALADFIESTQDYHVAVRFYSTEKASLPLSFRTFEGKTILVGIDRKKLPLDSFPFAIGDELIAIDEIYITEILSDLVLSKGKNVPGTDLAMADMFLTSRSARSNMKVPKGPVSLTFQRADENTPIRHQLIWDYQKEQIPGGGANLSQLTESATLESNKFNRLMPLPMMMSNEALDFADINSDWGIGKKTSFVPKLGEKIWASANDSIFDAYIYSNHAGKLVGVIRIPSYTPEDADAAIAEMAGLIQKMEKLTSVLVIDQVNNPGGSVFYLYSLVSLLISESATTPRHQMSLNEKLVSSAVDTLNELKSITTLAEAKKIIGETSSGYPVTLQFVTYVREYCNFIIEQWAMGKKLSDPYYIWGVDRINPHATTRYTKPIVLLVNELDFSGGDFFPAILQDNNRVTIFGTRTAGAGGYVQSIQFPNLFGFSNITITGSLAHRENHKPIENLGVTPDVEHNITVDDLRENLGFYTSQINEVVDSLIK